MAFSLFSSKNTSTQKSGDIPDHILKAVTIMGDKEEGNVPGNLPVAGVKNDNSSSPFLAAKGSSETVLAPPSPVFGKKMITGTGVYKNRMSFFIIGGCVILALTGLVLWYFWRNIPVATAPEAEVPETAVSPETLPTDPAQEAPFSLDTANYLSLDTETATKESVQTSINQKTLRLAKAKVTAPVEFLVTDKNNNPIAFSRLAYLMGLSFDPSLLMLLDEPFSLFLYQDASVTHIGISLTLKEPSIEGVAAIEEQEEKLPQAFQNLFYDDLVAPQKIDFRSGVYNGETVRYVNIDTEKNLSFDYTFRGNKWLIGTSKDTLRAILDKK